MIKIIKSGKDRCVYERECHKCLCIFQYGLTDTFNAVDYIGDSNGKGVYCPECRTGLNHCSDDGRLDPKITAILDT